MLFGIKTLGQFLRLSRRKEDGGPTVEFALVFMPFMVLSVSGFELGLLMTRHVMLERGVDMAVREVRLNTGTKITEVQFKTMVCQAAGIIDNCMQQVRLEMVNIDLWATVVNGTLPIPREASCTDSADPYLPARNFVHGVANEMMVVRACGLYKPMLPEFGLGFFLSRIRDEDRFYPLVSTTAFVMEPI